jgi:prepilin-type N-terminal cleavage/methylation domain-containing protein/prepilin-type processing-associated H-X9-DG protein
MIASKTPLSGACRTRRVRPAAFTLIELLTVIAIIGILAAILLPVVGKVRRTASSAQCASHMRQVGLAVQLYAEDNRGHLPTPGPGGSNIDDFHSGQGPWFNREQQRLQNHIGRYLGSPTATTWSTSQMDYDANFAWSAFTSLSQPGGASIVLNRKVRVRGSDTEISPWKRIAPSTYRGRKLDDIEERSRQVVFTEVDQRNTNAGWKNLCPPEPVHGAYRNSLYFDWHVAKVPLNG